MGAHSPGEETVRRAQRVPEQLAIAVPELLVGPPAPPRALREPPERDAKRRVEPDERVRLREDDVVELRPVVPVEYPPFGRRRDRGLDARTQLVARHLRPVRAVVEGVQLDVR